MNFCKFTCLVSDIKELQWRKTTAKMIISILANAFSMGSSVVPLGETVLVLSSVCLSERVQSRYFENVSNQQTVK